ncbi:hypothetical protein [Streptomyces aureoversilis]|uniref:Uncharacterized protein n=1 Tax=Streptomyces aureoversilis TaxID=67277 RepID=A0ABW0A8G2_9ACTN
MGDASGPLPRPEGQPQIYGTQYLTNAGELRPRPIEDPEQMDERRAAVGLEPHAGYDARMREGR